MESAGRFVALRVTGETPAQTPRPPSERAIAEREMRQDALPIAVGMTQLDLQKVLRTLQSLCSENNLEPLFDTLLRFVIETSAAEKCYLLLRRGQTLWLAAEAEVQNGHVTVRIHGEEESRESGLPVFIREDAQRSWQTPVLVDVLETKPSISSDLLRVQSKSLLRLPIVRRQDLRGLLYLERHADSAALTSDQHSVLQLITTQTAVLLDEVQLRAGLLQAEAGLATERNLLRTLVETIPDCIYAKDIQSRFIFANPAVARLVRATTADELLGKTDFDFYPAEVAALFFADEQALIRSGKPLIDHEECIIEEPMGERQWVLTSKVPVRGSEGQVTAIIGICRDITERKRAEAEILSLNAELERRVDERTAELVQTNTALQAEIAQRLALEVVLSTERQLLRTLVDAMPDAIYAKDLESRFVFGNVAVARMLGAAAPQDLLGKTDFDFFPAELAAKFFADEQAIIRAGKALIDHEEVISADQRGEIGWHSTTKVPIHDSDGKLTGIVGIGRNLTARKQTEQALRLRNRAIESSVNAILITDFGKPDNPIEYVNPAFERITGYRAEEALGRSMSFLFADEQEQVGVVEIQAALQGEQEARAVLRSFRKDGSLFWNDLHVAPVRDEAGNVTHFVWIVNDITEARNYEEQLRRQANYDALTGLPNRNLLEDRLTQAMAHARRTALQLAVLFLDLDRFKFINDSFGHAVGDALLKAIGLRLTQTVRESDTVARLGGDEFVIVTSGFTHTDEAASVAQKVLGMLAEPFKVEGQEIHVTASIGVSVYPEDGDSTDTLLKNADAAMYRAKEEGRDGFQFYAREMGVRTQERVALETALRGALERQEFELHYQPQVDLKSGQIAGVEALIRWQHPELGMVSPARFIPLAEETGLIVPIGQWVLQTACAQAKAWHAAGYANLSMAVNLSARQFRQNDITETVRRVLADTGLAAEHLELELTETLLMQDSETVVKALRKLKAIGVILSLDDFGTGYSSLSYLKRFPIDNVKIDRSFIHEVTSNVDDAAITKAIIAMARSLNMKTIAEGVETERQVTLLIANQCDLIQGYFFSRPLPAKDIEALLEEGRRLPDTLLHKTKQQRTLLLVDDERKCPCRSKAPLAPRRL
jgi:diguanylate cyclase (GGDEF)-like protein/PAS domain S-box-containing protein